jgi:hypothetical protein
VHQGDVLEIERLEQVCDHGYLTGECQICVTMHWATVCSQRQHGAQVPESGREQRQHLVPDRVVHQQAVEQHDRRSGPGVVAVELTGGHGNGSHHLPSLRTVSLERLF